MSVTVSFKCSGCFAEAEPVTARARREGLFSAAAGVTRDGWTVVKKPDIEALTPEGWVAFDPYTLLCYCPDCWAEIETVPSDTSRTTEGPTHE